jgi:cytochrome c553
MSNKLSKAEEEIHAQEITFMRSELRASITLASTSVESALHFLDVLTGDSVYDVEYAEGGQDVLDLRAFLTDARRFLAAARAMNPIRATEAMPAADADERAMSTEETRCVWCHKRGHTAEEHPLPKDHPQYDAFHDATDDELSGIVSTAVRPGTEN